MFDSMIVRTRDSSTPRARAMRGTCQSAAAGERWGSRPLAEALTSSAGTGPSALGFS